jgi:hypothetical protein
MKHEILLGIKKALLIQLTSQLDHEEIIFDLNRMHSVTPLLNLVSLMLIEPRP